MARAKMKPFLIAFLMTIMTITFQWSAAAQGIVREAQTSGALISKVAPGELLPVSVKLLNFGGGKRVDVTLWYRIFDSAGGEVLSISETVAVETTASFVKLVQVPHNFLPGIYTVRTDIAYAGQEVPATSQFPFTVERKFAGLFVNQLAVLGVSTFAVAAMGAFAGRFFVRRRRVMDVGQYDYLEVPQHERVFYRIIADTITQMRLRVGDDAMRIAQNISGLTVDFETGKVLKIEKDPSKIVALLVLRYETLLGQRVSFDLTKHGADMHEKTALVQKNVEVVRKYFE